MILTNFHSNHMQRAEQKSCEISEKEKKEKKETTKTQKLKLISWGSWPCNTSCNSESLASKICGSGFAVLTVFQNRWLLFNNDRSFLNMVCLFLK